MDTPTKSVPNFELGDELTPGTRDDTFFNFWEDRKAHVAKRLNFEDQEEEEVVEEEETFLKVNQVQLKRYGYGEKIVVRTTFIGKEGTTSKGDPVVTFFGMDETGEIAFSAYRDNVQKVLEIAKVGKIIEIQGFYASKEKEGRFSSSRTGISIRLTLVDQSTIRSTEADCIPKIPFNFTPLSEIEDRRVEDLIDAKGVIVKVNQTNEHNWRDVFITDSVQNTVKLSLYKDWNDAVQPEDCYKCLVLRRAAVCEFSIGKKFLRADWNTLIQVID